MNLLTITAICAMSGSAGFKLDLYAGSQPGAHFGSAIAAASSDVEPRIIIGEPGFDVGQTVDAGRHGELVLGVGSFPDMRPGGAVTGDNYGASVALGDFNGDGLLDPVIGAPGAEAIGHGGQLMMDAGVAILPYQSGSPLVLSQRSHFTGNILMASAGNRDRAAETLAVGDFNGDDFDDLVVAAPKGSFNVMQGELEVYSGSSNGLVAEYPFLMQFGYLGLPGTRTAGDRFGEALAAGDFNDDGYDDLAIGSPGDDGVGSVLIVFGSSNSLIFANHVYIGSFDLGRTPVDGDNFGAALATGDFNADGYADLAIGAPRMAVDERAGAGAVATLYGGAIQNGGFNFAATQWVDNPTPAVEERFGASLAIGRFTARSGDDLAVGAPLVDSVTTGTADVGEIYVYDGGRVGFDEPAVIRPFNAFDGAGAEYGRTLAAVPLSPQGPDLLAIGAPQRDAGAGGVVIAIEQFDRFADGFE